MDKLDLTSPDLTARNVEAVGELFPGVVTETRDADGTVRRAIDFDLLRQELSGHVVEGPQERYRLDWPGKRAALLAANAPIRKTLRPVREESVNFDTTKNLFIEGDNLEALKLLQESYLGKVKLIYIDPPYNTGNDFIYNDDFAETTAEYLARSGQTDESGAKLVANTESNGRFHSDWLSMMYPRLKLARNLLKDDGLLFMSIDDNESSSTRKMLDEIYGSENFVEAFVWESIFRPSNMSRRVRKNAETILCYSRDASVDFEFTERMQDAQGDASLTQANNSVRTLRFPAGILVVNLPDGEWAAGERADVRVEHPFRTEAGRALDDVVLTGRFKWQQGYLDEEIIKGALLQIKSESMIPYYRKVYQQSRLRPRKILPRDLVGDVLQANAEVRGALGFDAFDYPKPTSLISFLIRMVGVEEDSVILDFFAGSGTTAHSTIQVSSETGRNLRWIAVQLPEPTPLHSALRDAGFSTIAAVARARVRRAGAQMGDVDGRPPRDIGFRALTVSTSNLNDVLRVADATDQAQLDMLTDSIKSDRTGEDLLFQVLLNWGLELSVPIARETVDNREVFVVDDGALIACFAEHVTPAVVHEIAGRRPLRAVFRDSGFATDAERINAEQVFRQVSPTTDVKTI